MLSGRRDWLSITPEPERLLPRAIATLRSGGPPSEDAVARERSAAERIVLRGSRRRWLAWLARAEQLARRTPAPGAPREEELERARRETLAVIDNHNALMRGLRGPVARSRGPIERAQEETRR